MPRAKSEFTEGAQSRVESPQQRSVNEAEKNPCYDEFGESPRREAHPAR